MIYDIFVVCTTTATTGSVSVYDNYFDHVISLDVTAVAATGSEKDGDASASRSVCPWGDSGYPVQFDGGVSVKTSGATIKAYVLYRD